MDMRFYNLDMAAKAAKQALVRVGHAIEMLEMPHPVECTPERFAALEVAAAAVVEATADYQAAWVR